MLHFPGFFGGNLPDYQRAEVMMFIMGKVPVDEAPSLDTAKIGCVTPPDILDVTVPCALAILERASLITRRH